MTSAQLRNIALVFSIVLMLFIAPREAESDPHQGAATASDVITLPETTVTATRINQDIDTIGRSVAVRDEEEFSKQQNYNITDALQTVPALRTTSLGGPGSPGVAPLEIRGFRTGGTQLLLNGMKLNDPSAISGTFDNFIPHLDLHDISQVDILKGGSGVLYGSDGQGGAVNLLMREPLKGLRAEASIEAGSFDTLSESAALNYGGESQGVIATVSRTDSNGFDIHDDYEATTASSLDRWV